MPEYTSTATQTVTASQSVLFTETPVPCNRGLVMHREGSGVFTLRGPSCRCNQCFSRYRVSFGANIAVPATGAVATDPISLAIAIEGEPLASATMIETPGVISEFNNVFSSVFVTVPRECCMTVSVENNGTGPVDVANANLIIERVA